MKNDKVIFLENLVKTIDLMTILKRTGVRELTTKAAYIELTHPPKWFWQKKLFFSYLYLTNLLINYSMVFMAPQTKKMRGHRGRRE